jgi:hypothetical protein
MDLVGSLQGKSQTNFYSSTTPRDEGLTTYAALRRWLLMPAVSMYWSPPELALSASTTRVSLEWRAKGDTTAGGQILD